MSDVKSISPAAPTPTLKPAVEAGKSPMAAPKEAVSQGYIPIQGQASAQTPAPKEAESNKITREDANQIAEVMNQASQLLNNQLNFEVFEDTKQLYVQIVDKKTREVIKQIPPQEMLELSAKIREMVGIILDKYV
ncbi:MAG: flagellar protein FlaG [Clostridia bacterium]|jgi:flagellar protein FlaG|nr:flagellar protein FlaG [Clostridia bacterium]